MDYHDALAIENITDTMNHFMFKRIVICLAEKLGFDAVMETLDKLAKEGPLLDEDGTYIRINQCLRGCERDMFRKRMAEEFDRDLESFIKLGGDEAAYDFLDFLMFCMEKCDWSVTDESADDYNDMFDFIEDVIQNRRDPRIVFDLNVPMTGSSDTGSKDPLEYWTPNEDRLWDRYPEIRSTMATLPRDVLETAVLSIADRVGPDKVLNTMNGLIDEGLVPDDKDIIGILSRTYLDAKKVGFRKSLETGFGDMLRTFWNTGGDDAAYRLLARIRRNMYKVTWYLYDEDAPPEERAVYSLLISIIEERRDPFSLFDPKVPLPEP